MVSALGPRVKRHQLVETTGRNIHYMNGNIDVLWLPLSNHELKVETPYHDNDLILTPIYITTKWMAVNLKLPGISHGRF